MTHTSTVKLWRCIDVRMFWRTGDGLKDTCRANKHTIQTSLNSMLEWALKLGHVVNYKLQTYSRENPCTNIYLCSLLRAFLVCLVLIIPLTWMCVSEVPAESKTAASLCPEALWHTETDRRFQISPPHLRTPPAQCNYSEGYWAKWGKTERVRTF